MDTFEISDEAVEVAAKASYLLQEGSGGRGWGKEEQSFRNAYLEDARVSLEAVVPHMCAAAWEYGVTAGLNCNTERGEPFDTPNPFRPQT